MTEIPLKILEKPWQMGTPEWAVSSSTFLEKTGGCHFVLQSSDGFPFNSPTPQKAPRASQYTAPTVCSTSLPTWPPYTRRRLPKPRSKRLWATSSHHWGDSGCQRGLLHIGGPSLGDFEKNYLKVSNPYWGAILRNAQINTYILSIYGPIDCGLELVHLH